MRFSTVILLLSLFVLLVSSATKSNPIEDITHAEYEPYLSEYYPYSTYVSHAQYYVTISISGLPTEYSARIKIDGSETGSIRGSSSNSFKVLSTETHVFEVESLILRLDGTRYVCREPSWSLERTQMPYEPYAYYHYPYFDPRFNYAITTTTTTTTTATTTTTTTTTTTETTTTTTDTASTTESSSTATETSTTETTTTETTTSEPTTTNTTTSDTTTSTTTGETTTTTATDTTTTTESQSSPTETQATAASKDENIGVSEMLQRRAPDFKSNEASRSISSSGYVDSVAQYNPYFETYPDGQSYYYPSPYYYPYYPSYYQWQSDSNLEASHTFVYEPEYLLSVENLHGASIDKSGWKRKDSVITLSTPENIEKSDVEKSLFESWTIDGSQIHSSTVTVTMNAPHTVRATYRTQYYLEVRSELGQPEGSGWYDKDSTATISVPPEIPMAGFWGSLGGRYLFTDWNGIASGNRFSPTTTVTVDKPATVIATWRTDYPFNTALAIILVVIGILAITAVIATRGFPRLGKKEFSASDTLDLRYSRGEIAREEYLRMKKDLKA